MSSIMIIIGRTKSGRAIADCTKLEQENKARPEGLLQIRNSRIVFYRPFHSRVK